MSRYIDADKMMDGYGTTFPYDITYCDDGDLIEWLNAQPTADVVEVRHGRMHLKDHDEWYGAVYGCSLCGENWMLEYSSHKAHYCPWCGAKMDGERRELSIHPLENTKYSQKEETIVDKSMIIKALECLSKPNSSPDDRQKCYFMWKEPTCFNCYHEVARNALALIKELTEANATQIVTAIELDKQVERLTEENERLKVVLKMNDAPFPEGLDIVNKFCDSRIQEARADTVREMQDRLAMHFGTYRPDETIKVHDMFKLIEKISNEILNNTEDEEK